MTDIASLGLEIRSDGVVVATDRMQAFRRESGLAEAAAGTLKRAWQMSLAVVAAGVAAFGVGIAGAVKRLEDMRRMSLQVDQALRNSGNTARTSAREIEAWADKLETRTGRAAEEVMDAAANLASFGFARSEFFRSLELANDMTAAWGGSFRQNLEGLARALDDPLNGMAMLSKRGIKLTDDQKVMAEAFLNAGDKIAAQGVVFEALEAQVKGVAEAGYGGLTAALGRAQKAWDDAFEDLVKGNGVTGDLRDTLVTLAETVSSPEFIRSVMGFGTILVQGMNAVAQAVVWAWGKMQEFLSWLSAQNPSNMSSSDISKQIADTQELIRLAEQSKARPGFSVFEGIAGAVGAGPDDRIAAYQKRVDELQRQLNDRSNPSAFNVGGTFDQLKGANTFDSPDAMWRFMSPGTMFGQDGFNPYAGMDFATESAEKAAKKMQEMWNGLEDDLKPLLTTINDPFTELQSNLDKLGAWLQHEGPAGWDAYSEGVRRANLQATASVLGSVGQITGILSGAFEDNKLLAAANAAINTAEGVTKALAQGGMFAIPTAIAIGAAGAAQIAAIMSANPGGATVTQPSLGGGGAGPTASAPAQASKNVIINLHGNANTPTTQGAVKSLMDQLNEELGNEGKQFVTRYIGE